MRWILATALLAALAMPACARVICVSTAGNDLAATGSSLRPYRTIQKAINASRTGDTVQVQQGIYRENIDFRDRGITLTSTNPLDPSVVAGTIIDGSRLGWVIWVSGSVRGPVAITGFTITNGRGGIGACAPCFGPWQISINSNVVRDNDGEGISIGGFGCEGQSVSISGCTVSGNMREGIMVGGLHRANIAFCLVEHNARRGMIVWCPADCGPESYISHCTVTNNDTWDGGGIAAGGTIEDCIVANNKAWNGAGIVAWGDATVSRCTITGNTAAYSIGGGVYVAGEGHVVLNNNLICGNMCILGRGAGVYSNSDCSLTIANCTIERNIATPDVVVIPSLAEDFAGGGVYLGARATLMTNTIVRGNEATFGAQVFARQATVRYCNIEGGREGVYEGTYYGGPAQIDWQEGNVDVDPLYAAEGHWDDNGTPDDYLDDTWFQGDYHLKSQVGRWDPAVGGFGGWVADGVMSPCIDTGDPDWSYANEPGPNGGRVNVGAYGNTVWASKGLTEGIEDIRALHVGSAHASGASEAVWPVVTAPSLTWVSNINRTVGYVLDVSADAGFPADDPANTFSFNCTGVAASYTPTSAEWLRMRRLAAATGGLIYWRVRALLADSTLYYTSAAKDLVIDGGEWAVSDLSMATVPANLSWSHAGDGIVNYTIQISTEPGFPAKVGKTIYAPAKPICVTSYAFKLAQTRVLKRLAARHHVTALYYRIRGEDQERAFVTYSGSKTVSVP